MSSTNPSRALTLTPEWKAHCGLGSSPDSTLGLSRWRGEGLAGRDPMQSEGRYVPKGLGALGFVENEAAFDAGLSTGSTAGTPGRSHRFPASCPRTLQVPLCILPIYKRKKQGREPGSQGPQENT